MSGGFLFFFTTVADGERLSEDGGLEEVDEFFSSRAMRSLSSRFYDRPLWNRTQGTGSTPNFWDDNKVLRSMFCRCPGRFLYSVGAGHFVDQDVEEGSEEGNQEGGGDDAAEDNDADRLLGAGAVGDGEGEDAEAGAATSRPSCSFPVPGSAAIPRHWPRFSGWSPTRSPGTRGSGVCGFDEISSPQ